MKVVSKLKKKTDHDFLHPDKTGTHAVMDKRDYIRVMKDGILHIEVEKIEKDQNNRINTKVSKIMENDLQIKSQL